MSVSDTVILRIALGLGIALGDILNLGVDLSCGGEVRIIIDHSFDTYKVYIS